MNRFLLLCGLLVVIGCGSDTTEGTAQGEWIKGSEQEKLEAIESHIGGLGTAMIQIDHRYQELYWAGKDENWEYADYQLEDLEGALRKGLQRRPRRAASAEHFLEVTLPDMKAGVESRNRETFMVEFEKLKQGCNNCHAMEEVPFIQVQTPDLRSSSIWSERRDD